jgi:hypothetical protein
MNNQLVWRGRVTDTVSGLNESQKQVNKGVNELVKLFWERCSEAGEGGGVVMSRMITSLFSVAFAMSVLGVSVCSVSAATLFQSFDQPEDHQPIKVTIATVNPLLNAPTQSYRFGQQIPVAINLTNTTNSPVYSCLSGDIYQDLPRLKRNGQLVPYLDWQSYLLQTAARDQTCEKEDIPDQTLLLPNKPKLVDLMVLVDDRLYTTGAIAWYDQLVPGHYELSVQRRFGCCGGPMVESNTVDFEVTP